MSKGLIWSNLADSSLQVASSYYEQTFFYSRCKQCINNICGMSLRGLWALSNAGMIFSVSWSGFIDVHRVAPNSAVRIRYCLYFHNENKNTQDGGQLNRERYRRRTVTNLHLFIFSMTVTWLELWTTTQYCDNSHITWHLRLYLLFCFLFISSYLCSQSHEL